MGPCGRSMRESIRQLEGRLAALSGKLDEARAYASRISDELSYMTHDGKPAEGRDCELGESQPTTLGLRVQNYYKEGQLRDIAAEAERALQTIEMLRHDVGPNGLVDLLERRVRFIKGMAE